MASGIELMALASPLSSSCKSKNRRNLSPVPQKSGAGYCFFQKMFLYLYRFRVVATASVEFFN